HDDNTVTFDIKALGDYTSKLPRHLTAGSSIKVEGPYGRFEFSRANKRARQIWIAGGIGITPFLAWLESLQNGLSDDIHADLHYCIRDREADPFVPRLQQLTDNLPQIHLHLHDMASGELTAETLTSGEDASKSAEIWFCGPVGLAKALSNGLHRLWAGKLRFHQEAFEIR
ncbi:MAG: ferric reductase, partial [Gammaproteobacteria bacterium]|nr:ferric reductase [Gammaproteobacteria bacterium]